jgi:hypothetical protein
MIATKNAEAKNPAGNSAFLEREAKPQLIQPNAHLPTDALVPVPLLSIILRIALRSTARRKSRPVQMIEGVLLPLTFATRDATLP